MTNNLTYALIGTLGICLGAGCAPAPPPPRPAPVAATAVNPQALVSPVSINAEMVWLIDHASHQLWNAEQPDMAPTTEVDWENLVEHATQIAAAGVLIRLPGTGPSDQTFVQHPDWHKYSMAVSTAGLAALKAAEAKSQEALIVANGQLVDACEGCHAQFKPALPTEGITHRHAH